MARRPVAASKGFPCRFTSDSGRVSTVLGGISPVFGGSSRFSDVFRSIFGQEPSPDVLPKRPLRHAPGLELPPRLAEAHLLDAFLVGFAVLGISDNILPLALFTEPLGGLGAVASRRLGAPAPRGAVLAGALPKGYRLKL